MPIRARASRVPLLRLRLRGHRDDFARAERLKRRQRKRVRARGRGRARAGERKRGDVPLSLYVPEARSAGACACVACPAGAPSPAAGVAGPTAGIARPRASVHGRAGEHPRGGDYVERVGVDDVGARPAGDLVLDSIGGVDHAVAARAGDFEVAEGLGGEDAVGTRAIGTVGLDRVVAGAAAQRVAAGAAFDQCRCRPRRRG